MHQYTIFGHDRVSVGRWLGFASVTIAAGLSQLLISVSELTGIYSLASVAVTAGAVYFTLHGIFNMFAWKLSVFSIPGMDGTWNITGFTLNETGKRTNAWKGELVIEQSWSHIAIGLKTKDSHSYSYAATLSKRSDCWVVGYNYSNEPNSQKINQLDIHKGYCEIEFNKGLTKGKGSYYNNKGRTSRGIFTLRKNLQ